MREITAAGLALITSFEGFSSIPYQDEDGVWTIGYGHTDGVTADTRPVTKDQAQRLLQQDLHKAEESVCAAVTVPLSDNQYAALISLVYNVGPAPLAGTLGQRLSSGDIAGAAQEFLRWRLVDGAVSDGLVRRREAERALFLTK